MIGDIAKKVGKFILKYSKYFFPGFALIVAAVIVFVAMKYRAKEEEAKRIAEEELAQQLEEEVILEDAEVPLEDSSDEALRQLVDNYFACLSEGDMATLQTLRDSLDEAESFRLEEQSKYLSYSVEHVYSQTGPEEGTYIAYAYYMVVFDEFPTISLPAYSGFYVKTADTGELYIVKGELSDKENEYISKVASQDDVKELNNKVNVEYNDIIIEHPEILDYLVELDTTVSTAVGEKIAEINSTIEAQKQAEEEEQKAAEGETEDVPAEEVVQYATATTRVNVRASDSAQAERIGEAMQGEKFEVVEVLLNGWTKIIFKEREAFIKSEYLSMVQSAESYPTIGMATAKSEVNVRSLPDVNSEKVGALVTGDQLELVAVEDGWCTVKFEDTIAYVNADFIDYTVFD